MLATLDQVKAALGVAGAAEDDALTTLIGQASRAVEDHCGRPFTHGPDRLVTLLTRGEYDLALPRWPVSAVTKATVNGVDVAVTVCGRNKHMLWRADGGSFFGTVEVDYVGGWKPPGDPAADLPATVTRAVILLVQQYRAAASRDPTIRSQTFEQVGSETYQVGGLGLGDDVKSLLAPYKIWQAA